MDQFQAFKRLFQTINPAAELDQKTEDFLKEKYIQLQNFSHKKTPGDKGKPMIFGDLYENEIFYIEGQSFMKTGPTTAVRWSRAKKGGDQRKKMRPTPRSFSKDQAEDWPRALIFSVYFCPYLLTDISDR